MSVDAPFNLLWVHLVQCTVVALIAFALVKLLARDRPHLAHALWAIALIKCVTPPVFASPSSVFSWVELPAVLSRPQAAENLARSPDNHAVTRSISAEKGLYPKGDVLVDHVSARPFGAAIVTGERVLMIWITGATLILGSFLARLGGFLVQVRRYQRASLQTLAPLNRRAEEITRRVAQKLKLRSAVRVSVLDARIGPAILGILRPCVLLPKVIVENSSDAELEALIAHELVHVRRGDLGWSIVQALAIAATWCNPLTWTMSRRLEQEAERCCDEETVACLGISPSSYAKCLVSVLERKHMLRAAPLLPGIRPLDVTAKRLERIMRFGNGIQNRCPSWVRLTALVGAIIVLPGAAMSTANDPPATAKPNDVGVRSADEALEAFLFEVQLISAPKQATEEASLADDETESLRSMGTVIEVPNVIAGDGQQATVQFGFKLLGDVRPVVEDDRISQEPETRSGEFELKLTGSAEATDSNVTIELEFSHWFPVGEAMSNDGAEGSSVAPFADAIKSTFRVPLGETHAVTGKPYKRFKLSEHRVPLLSSIPQIGALFQSKGITAEDWVTTVVIRCTKIEFAKQDTED